MIVEISQILTKLSPQWACILSNGNVINTSLEGQILGKMVRILRAVINDVDVGTVITVKDLIIFRITFDFFVFIIGDSNKSDLKQKFSHLYSHYKEPLKLKYHEEEDIGEKIVPKITLFSMTLSDGPTPIFHISDSKFDKVQIQKICMKSLLLLSVESQGAVKSMISFQPYIELDSIGIVYVFQIKDSEARGGAYDSAISILIDYECRAILYENYSKIENYLISAKNGILKEYYDGKDYKKVLEALKENLSKITFESLESDDLKADMMHEIKKLAKLSD